MVGWGGGFNWLQAGRAGEGSPHLANVSKELTKIGWGLCENCGKEGEELQSTSPAFYVQY